MTSRYVDANISAQGVQMQTGTVITGVSTIPAVYATGIAYAKKYDLYLNISTHNVYQCATEGNAATATWKYLTNIKGATGFSPSADISKSGNIATINITDELGRTTATVMDGTDGISPQASVAAISGGARITITDANGTTAQNVMDGADGKGNNWYTGNAITGTSITPSVYATGIANAFAGDMYLNNGALPNTGREYVCTTGGSDSTALWKYNALLRGADGQGTGDMLKSTYDHDSDGIVDDAERLGGNLPSYYAAAKNIPAAQIQSDWNQSAATALSFINNKPTLGSLAAKNTISTDDISDSIVIDCKLAKMSAITLKGNASTNIATPADLTAAQVRTMLNVVDGADATGTALELTTAIDAIADADKIIIEDVSAAAGLQTKHVLWSS
ncbi:MAG: hypothetical protein RR365_10420, partial [Bacteroides sp.]